MLNKLGYSSSLSLSGVFLVNKSAARDRTGFTTHPTSKRAFPSCRSPMACIYRFSTVIAGLLTWGFQLEHASTWWVTPCVGAAIASFGNQIQTTILTTFAVESRRERAAEVGVFVNICRQIYGFVNSPVSFSIISIMLTFEYY